MSKRKKGQEKSPTTSNNSGTIVFNRKAKFQYHLTDKYEAGLVLTGNEIKSIRAGQISLQDAYVRPKNGELFLIGAHISEYKHSSAKEYDPVRPRKLLLHRREINKLMGQVEQKNMTIVPVRLYLTRGKAKLEIALAKGKLAPDKRDAIKSRESKRETERLLKESYK